MPEHLRALAIITVIAATVFVTVRTPLAALTSLRDFDRRCALWFGITLAAFISHDFWIFVVCAGTLLAIAASKESNKIAMVLFVLLAVPLIRAEVPGFGGIRYFFELEYFRLIVLVVLLPCFIRAWNERALRPIPSGADWFLFGYLFLNGTLMLLASGITGILRGGFLLLLDVFIPYVLASRLLKDVGRLREAMASYVAGAAVMAVVGIFEFGKGWLLYSSLEQALEVHWNFGSYLRREDHLRAMGTAGQAIPYGYTMAVAFVLLLGLRRSISSRAIWLAGIALFLVAGIASYSRGPWLGMLAAVLVYALSGQQIGRNLFRAIVFAILVIPIVLLTPIGEKIVAAVTVESGSFDYRKKVLEISLGVIFERPLFGAFSAMYSPAMQELRQGQGIIDIVNTYIGIGLRSGLIGLFLFGAFFVTVLTAVWRRIQIDLRDNQEAALLGRGLLATVACILVSIFTVSSITFIPIVYYLVAGMAISYAIRNHTAGADEKAVASRTKAIRYSPPAMPTAYTPL
jgi:O-antigen ligase